MTDLDDLPDDGAWMPPTRRMADVVSVGDDSLRISVMEWDAPVGRVGPAAEDGVAVDLDGKPVDPWHCPHRCPGEWTDPMAWAVHIRDEHRGRLTADRY